MVRGQREVEEVVCFKGKYYSMLGSSAYISNIESNGPRHSMFSQVQIGLVSLLLCKLLEVPG